MLNWADWLILVILVISGLISLKRGFVKEALSLAIWLIAFLLASWFSLTLAPLLADFIKEPSLRQMVAFAGIFVATLISGSIVNYLVATMVKVTGLSGTDRMLGILFGFLRGVIIVMVLVLYLPKIVEVQKDTWWQRSLLIPHFQNFEDQFKMVMNLVYTKVRSSI